MTRGLYAKFPIVECRCLRGAESALNLQFCGHLFGFRKAKTTFDHYFLVGLIVVVEVGCFVAA